MTASCGAAAAAFAAADGDLADHATADPGRVGRPGVLDDADELVARDAREAGVAAKEFEVGAADAGGRDANEAFVARVWLRRSCEVKVCRQCRGRVRAWRVSRITTLAGEVHSLTECPPLFPNVNRSDTAPEIPGDLLPRLEAVGWQRSSHFFPG